MLVRSVPHAAPHRAKIMKEKPLKIAMVREEFAILTGSFLHALVLNQFNYYQLAVKHVDAYIAQENARNAAENGKPEMPLTEGWFYKTADELCEELMFPFKKSRALEIIDDLIARGWVMVRQNPQHKYDRTKQYRLNLVALHQDLRELGFSLPKWDTRGLENRGNAAPQNGTPFPPRGNDISTTWKTIPEEEIPKDKNPFPCKQGDQSSRSPENRRHANPRARMLTWTIWADQEVPPPGDTAFQDFAHHPWCMWLAHCCGIELVTQPEIRATLALIQGRKLHTDHVLYLALTMPLRKSKWEKGLPALLEKTIKMWQPGEGGAPAIGPDALLRAMMDVIVGDSIDHENYKRALQGLRDELNQMFNQRLSQPYELIEKYEAWATRLWEARLR